jgi:excisionase family DNA binding protein
MGIPPIFVSVQEAADALNITRGEMYKLTRAGAIASSYHGRRRLVSVDSLRAYADALPTDREAS